jgi:hypothetical protein
MPIIAKNIPEHAQRLAEIRSEKERKAAEAQKKERIEAKHQALKGKLKNKKWKDMSAADKDDLLRALAIKFDLIDENQE